MNYNRLLKRAVSEHPSMVWLDIFDDFVELRGGGWELREELELDGTHMHPRYLASVETWMVANGFLSM